MRFGDTDNLWLRRGTQSPLFVFAGHTDVVPVGDEQKWTVPPFSPTVRDGQLWGRGVADMKGGIAAMVTAIERFVSHTPQHAGSIALLLTSDEEGPATDGTVKVMEVLEQRHEKIDCCVVGEPSSTQRVGDVIKIGRRGSLGLSLSVVGIQGHVAYPQLADNPIHRATPALLELIGMQWDNGNTDFPPTSFQMTSIKAGAGADNVTPATLDVSANFRFSSEQSYASLQKRVEATLSRHNLSWETVWKYNAEPFLTHRSGRLVSTITSAIGDVCGYSTTLSTSGGTSDGRFIAPTGAEVVELGLCNATIHQPDERVTLADLDVLSSLYERILTTLLA